MEIIMWKSILLLGILIAVTAYPAEHPISVDDRAEELENEFQGDMIISQAELDAYNGRLDESLRWPNNIVPYEIDTTYFNAEQVAHIHEAANTINRIGCLLLIPRTNQADYIQFSGDSTGCSSSVGRRGGRQLIRLAPNTPGVGCFRLYTIVHEFLHAFGFHHMHSSHDRDEYVEIRWENIQVGTENNFNLYGAGQVTHFGVPYEYGSVMHYSATGFSVNGQPTIVARNPLNGQVMGQRTQITASDILRLERMYGCAPWSDEADAEIKN